VFNRSLIIVAVVVIALSPLRALAAPCDVSWLLENRNIPSSRVTDFKNQGMYYLTLPTSRIRMLVSARNRIGAVAGSVPDLLI